MQAKLLGTLLVSLAALSGSMAAEAAGETLTYTGADFTSTYGNVAANSDFTVTVTLSTTLGANLNNVNEASYIQGLTFTTVQGGVTDTLSLTGTKGAEQAAGSVFDFTTNSAGVITGWDFTTGVLSPLYSNGASVPDPTNSVEAAADEIIFHSCSSTSKTNPCVSGSYNNQNWGATGDWYDYKPGPDSTTSADACTYQPANGCGSYGGTGSVGKWTVAPELNASSAGAGLTLFFGILAVMVGRRRATLAATA